MGHDFTPATAESVVIGRNYAGSFTVAPHHDRPTPKPAPKPVAIDLRDEPIPRNRKDRRAAKAKSRRGQ